MTKRKSKSTGVGDVLDENLPADAHVRRRPAKGLPEDDSLRDLAATFLKAQHRLWPDLARQGLLPKPTDANVARMADQFRQAFEAGASPAFCHDLPNPPWAGLGAAYVRYSDAGSNPRSLAQQLLNVLERARQLDAFVPWEFVFADAAVTGTVAARRGYQLAKAVVRHGPAEVRFLFIDELGRASRDAVEALHLGRLIELAGRRMVGATDGFDSASPAAKMQLHVYAMVHELFVDQLREKVKRGMRDAFQQGKNLHAPALGYKLVPALDEGGRPALDEDERPRTRVVIEEDEARAVREAFELYADRAWSRGRIARAFNAQAVGGTRTWDASRVRQLLERSTYRGVEFYEMTRQVRDPATGRVNTKRRPQAEWKQREVPHLRIVPDDLWDRAAARLAKGKEVYDRNRKGEKPSRTELHATTLVRPVCGACGKPLWLGRGGKYSSFSCLQGIAGKAGCAFKGYKSVRIVENAVIGRVAQEVLTDEFLAEVVEAANRVLDEQPDVVGDTKALEDRVRKKRRAIDAVTAQLGDADGTADLKPVFARVAALEREATDLERELAATRARNRPKPPPLTAEAVAALLDDLRDLLRDDVGAAAPILADLTGPVVVTQEPAEGGGKPTWVARFTLNAVPVLLALAAKRGCPTTGTWEFLNARGWTTARAVAVALRATPKHEAIAAEAGRLAANGATPDVISRVLRTTPQTARAAVTFARSGGTPPPEFRPKVGGGATPDDPVAAEVVRLRDEEGWSFARIAARLGIAPSTATRMYDRLQPGVLRRAAEAGETPDRGRYRHLDRERLSEIERRLRAGDSPKAIAKAVGCGVSTVHRERHRLGLAASNPGQRT